MTLTRDPLNLIIAGVGGQGNVLASHILASTGIREGYYVTVSETYGASQRGGAVMSHVRFSLEAQCGPLIPEGRADIIVGMEPAETLRVLADFGHPHTGIIVSPRPVYPVMVLSGQAAYPPVEEILGNIAELAGRVEIVKTAEASDTARVANVLLLGALAGSGMVPVSAGSFEEAIREIVPAKVLKVNLQAFRKGLETIQPK